MDTPDKFRKESDGTPSGWQLRRRVGDRDVYIFPQTYGKAKLAIGAAGSMFLDDQW